MTFFATIVAAYRFLWECRRDLVSYAFLPVVLVSFVQTGGLWATDAWQFHFDPGSMPEPAVPPGGNRAALTAWLVGSLASFVAYVMFSVAWFRRHLIGNEGSTVGAAMRWGRRHWGFVRRLVTLIALSIAAMVTAASLADLIAPPGNALGLFVRTVMAVTLMLAFARLLLVFPAVSTDRPLGFRASARLTRGRSWQMLGLYLLPFFPVLLAFAILQRLSSILVAEVIGPSLSFLLIHLLVQQAVAFVGIAAQATSISIVYRQLTAGAANPAV